MKNNSATKDCTKEVIAFTANPKIQGQAGPATFHASANIPSSTASSALELLRMEFLEA